MNPPLLFHLSVCAPPPSLPLVRSFGSPLNNLNAVIFLPFYRELPPRKSLLELSGPETLKLLVLMKDSMLPELTFNTWILS